MSFVRVAELGGFTVAAKALSTTTSAVTKSVTRLEEGLGVQLVHRTTRRMHLTEYGAEYYERCRQILADLDDAEGSIREANIAPSGPVRIALPPSFGRMTVIPALAEFYEQYPKVVLDLCLKSQTANPIEGGFDLVVHSGRLMDSRLINRILVRGVQKTVAAPSYIERYGKPETPEDLAAHNCITGAFGPNWHFRGEGGGENVVRVSGALITDSGDILREAAVKGLGISQATWWLFREELKRGQLVPLLEDYEIEAEPIAIVFPANRRTPAKVRAVVDFLLKITRSSDT
ncbi:LysR family transcriptional regulator [Rhizobium sp. BK376]|nr:LysR family transcriptional regulator [Rhizobium sp. BK376]